MDILHVCSRYVRNRSELMKGFVVLYIIFNTQVAFPKVLKSMTVGVSDCTTPFVLRYINAQPLLTSCLTTMVSFHQSLSIPKPECLAMRMYTQDLYGVDSGCKRLRKALRAATHQCTAAAHLLPHHNVDIPTHLGCYYDRTCLTWQA